MTECPPIKDWYIPYSSETTAFIRHYRPLPECEQIILKNPNLAVWFIPGDKGNGFDFFVGSFVCGSGTGPEPWMAQPDTQVECVMHGVAYFDGVRHLYFGHERSDNVGYLYSFDPRDLSAALRVLAELERRFCSAVDHRREE